MLDETDWNLDFEFRIGFEYNGESKWTAIYSTSMQFMLNNCMTSKNDDIHSPWMYRAPLYVAIGVGSAATAAVALPVIGFTTGGVAAGSIAASIHSWIGVVGGGSAFASLQSLGALGGLSTSASAAIGAAGATISGVIMESSAKKAVDQMLNA